MCRKDIERKCLNKLAKLRSSEPFIHLQIIIQINTLKLFDTEPCKAIPKKNFVSEEANNCEEKINLAPQDRIGNIDWCICRCECKLMATFAESFCLLLGINHRRVRGASRPSALWQLPDYQPHQLALVHDFLVLPQELGSLMCVECLQMINSVLVGFCYIGS